jgi:hypothetical protein
MLHPITLKLFLLLPIRSKNKSIRYLYLSQRKSVQMPLPMLI